MASFVRNLILLSGVCLAAEAGLVGSNECTYGPAYWCGSLRNAKQCSAVSHCIQTVWEKQQLPEDNDSICDICKNMVKQARDQLKSNETQNDIKAVFEGSCRLIPLEEISKECIELADEFIPELIETLASQMNPQIVCATAGLCNSVRIDRILRDRGLTQNVAKPKQEVIVASHVSDPDPGDCNDCNKFVQDTITLVNEHSKEELLVHLLAICGELGSLSDGCGALMTENIDAIHDYLSTQLNAEDTCTLFGMCGGNQKAIAKPASANTGDEACDFCIVIAQHWRDVLTSNTTEEQFKDILKGLCRKTGSFQGECLSLVDNYYLDYYNWLISEFNPKQVCEAVGICGTNKNKAVWTSLHTGPDASSHLQENKLEGPQPGFSVNSIDRASLTFVGRDEANSYKQPSAALLPRVKLQSSIKVSVAGESGVLPNGDQACTMCQFTLHFIQMQLGDKSTREEIENAVKTVCDKLPQNLREQCDDYVDAYGNQVIALLQQQIDPSVVCPMMGLCPSSSTERVLAVAPTADVSCVACEYIMVKLKEMLKDKSDQEAVRTALDKVCSILPSSIRDECTTFVDDNAIEVMQLIAGGVEPVVVCRLLGMCENHTAAALTPLNASNQLPISRLFVPQLRTPVIGAYSLEHGGQSKVCVVCEFSLAVLEKLLLDNNTHIADKIEQSVEQVCLLLPTTLQEDCLGFIEQYSKAIIELLINGLKPEYVCRELHLCKQPNLSALPRHVIKKPLHVITKRSVDPDDHRCLVCKAVVTTYKGSSTGDADAAVATFCSALTGDDQLLCSGMDLTRLAGLLTSNNSSSTTSTCADLDYCRRPSGLLGSEQCTYGPSFWCQSLLHATSCGGAPFCMENVWQGGVP